jgi:hypothetical protein
VKEKTMTIQVDPSTDTGSWMSSRQDNLPTIYAHSSLGAKADDPVTIFWGGNTSSERLIGFFNESLNCATTTTGNQVFRTFAVTSDGEKVFAYIISSPENIYAQFLRLEHVLSSTGDLSDPDTITETDYVAWARLNEVSSKVNDSIGVYLRPSKVANMVKLLAVFVSETLIQPMTYQQAINSIREISDNLTQLL